MTIHFICRGNVLRSLTAETYLRSLELPNVDAISSGTNVDITDPQEQEYFSNTLALLDRHGIRDFAEAHPEKLTQERIDASDMVIIVNQRAYEEAKNLVTLPANTIVWAVVDIGEGNRIATESNRLDLEDLIYKEITTAVDDFVRKNLK